MRISQETRKLVSSVITQFLPTYKNEQIRCSKVMSLCAFLLREADPGYMQGARAVPQLTSIFVLTTYLQFG